MNLEEIVDEVLSKNNSLITGVIRREENGKRAYKIHIGSKCGDGFLYENEHGEVVLEGRYQEIDTINSFDDIVYVAFTWFNNYSDSDVFSKPDGIWLPFFIKNNLVEEVIVKTYKAKK